MKIYIVTLYPYRLFNGTLYHYDAFILGYFRLKNDAEKAIKSWRIDNPDKQLNYEIKKEILQ